MEQLIFILFVLFTVFSALMERRKRKRAREAMARGETPGRRAEEEEEANWPFPGDPFEVLPRPPVAEPEMDQAVQDRLAAEQHAQELQSQALELEQRARQVQPRRRMEELMREKMAVQEGAEDRRRRRRRKAWSFDPRRARRAVIYAEILGRPKADRTDEI